MWLEVTNLHLAPKQQGSFEIFQVHSPLTYCLCLPAIWKIHDILHASLLFPYKEIKAYGSNFSKPPFDLIGTEKEYKVKQIVSHQGTLELHGRDIHC